MMIYLKKKSKMYHIVIFIRSVFENDMFFFQVFIEEFLYKLAE